MIYLFYAMPQATPDSAPRRRAQLALYGPVLSVATGLAWFAFASVEPPPTLRGGTEFQELDPPRPLPAFVLDASDGSVLETGDLEGHWTLLSIGFASCPDVCPNTLDVLSDAAAESPGTRVLFVSVDPERDSLERLRAYTAHFGPHVDGATGSHEALRRLTEPLGLFHAHGEAIDGRYDVEHATTVLAVSPKGEVAGLISGGGLRHETVVEALRHFRGTRP